MEYTFDQAAYALGTGRNTLTRTLRKLGMLDANNMPAGPWRNRAVFSVVTSTFNHPTKGPTPYQRTHITEKGLGIIRLEIQKNALSGNGEEIPLESLESATGRFIAPGNQPKEKTMKYDQNQQPAARLHDVGELTVINQDHGRVHHRYAVVLVFDSQEEAEACVQQRSLRLVPSKDLNPEITEAMNHGG